MSNNKKRVNLKNICEFIQADDKNSDIMDCYQEFQDGSMDQNTLVEICQNVLDSGREDWMDTPDKEEYLKYTKYLGI